MGYLWAIGVVLVVLASVENTIGILLMKRSFGETGHHEGTKDKLLWVGGLILMILGAASDFIAFGFAAQSLIAPLGATTLLCNAILSPMIVGEKVAKSDWVASAVITTGCVVALVFGDHSTKTYTFDELMKFDSHPGVIVFILFSVFMVLFLFFVAFRIEMPAKLIAIDKMLSHVCSKHKSVKPGHVTVRTHRHHNPVGLDPVRADAPRSACPFCIQEAELGAESSVGTGAGTGTAAKLDTIEEVEEAPMTPKRQHSSPSAQPSARPGDLTIREGKYRKYVLPPTTYKFGLWCCGCCEDIIVNPDQIRQHIPQGKWRMIHGCVLAAGGGLIGALSVMFGKTIAELVKPSFTDSDGSAFAEFGTYLIILAMCGTLFVQMLSLNHALQFHTAIFIVPIYQTFWIIGSIVGGGVYFEEFSNLDTVGIVMFVLGVCIVIVGVYILTYCRWKRWVSNQEIVGSDVSIIDHFSNPENISEISTVIPGPGLVILANTARV